jgi:hypothetical protein
VPVPYQFYDGYGVLIGGTADLAAVHKLLVDEEVKPTHNADGRALMGIWLCDFLQASLGPHHELQISFFVSRGESTPIAAKRIALLAAMLARPEMQMMCHGLWNNTPTVVAYNRELLSLNARLSRSEITRNSELLTATVTDAENGRSLLKATLIKPDHASPGATFALLSQLGFGRAMQVNRQPWIEMQIVNPLGVKLAHNGTAMAYTSNATNHVRYFDPQRDQLQLDAEPYASFDFRPEFVQQMTGFKFVYEEPI